MVSAAFAQPASTSAYQEAVDAGLTAFRAKHYAQARQYFERADALEPSARTLRALGLTAVEQKRYTLAREELNAALTDPRQPLTPGQRTEIEQMMTWMHGALATVHAQLVPPQAQLKVDHEIVPHELVLEPGEHSFEVAAAGFEPTTLSERLTAGQDWTLEVALKRLPLAPESAAKAADTSPSYTPSDTPAVPLEHKSVSVLERWWFWTAVGVVVVGGTVTAIALAGKKSGPTEPAGNAISLDLRGH